MKKKIIISVFAAILIMAISFTARAMILASIAYYECYACGACINEGEPFFVHDDGTAWFDHYQSLEWGMLRFYGYPAAAHQDVITEAEAVCPSKCIFIE